MKDNIFLLLTAILASIVSWGLFQLIGEYMFLIGLIAVFIQLMQNSKGPKFGNKNKPSEQKDNNEQANDDNPNGVTNGQDRP